MNLVEDRGLICGKWRVSLAKLPPKRYGRSWTVGSHADGIDQKRGSKREGGRLEQASQRDGALLTVARSSLKLDENDVEASYLNGKSMGR